MLNPTYTQFYTVSHSLVRRSNVLTNLLIFLKTLSNLNNAHLICKYQQLPTVWCNSNNSFKDKKKDIWICGIPCTMLAFFFVHTQSQLKSIKGGEEITQSMGRKRSWVCLKWV